jgi:hypothetical protein
MTDAMDEEKQGMNTGQTSVVSVPADYSKVSFLNDLDKVYIKQPIRAGEFLAEMFCGCEISNFYTVQAVNEQANTTTMLFDLREESNCCLRQCCGAQRPLQLMAVPPGSEDTENPIFIIDKPYRMGCCCCDATNCMGRNYMEVWLGDAMIGSVQEKCLCNCRVAYGVHDANNSLLYSIERCACYCECMKVGFKIMTPDGEETGKSISKLYGGMLKEMFTVNDNFLCEFPSKDISTQVKLLLICASMMIEFNHFERK